MARSGPERNGGGHKHRTRAGNDTVVRFDPDAARSLVASYREAGGALWDAGLTIGPLIRRAADVLGGPVAIPPFAEIGIELGHDADDLEWRVGFVESTDGFDFTSLSRNGEAPPHEWSALQASRLSYGQLAELLARVDNGNELEGLVEWMFGTQAFFSFDAMRGQPTIPLEYRPIFAGALITAYDGGWQPGGGELPSWLGAGMIAHGNPSDEMVVELGRAALADNNTLDDLTQPNPFELEASQGPFGPFAAHFTRNPAVGRRFINSLMDDFDRSGDSRLNKHGDGSLGATQLADVVVAAGTHGSVTSREVFVDRLVRTINGDRDTNEPVFWATWAVHADLAIHHDVVTTEPTFGTHHLVPDFIRPTWEKNWHEHVSPIALDAAFGFVQQKKQQAELMSDVMNPDDAFIDWVTNNFGPKPYEAGNDAGGTYTTRVKDDFHGLRFHFSDADRGRNVITHALRDGSDKGDIAQDEFAIIDHGIGANGNPTYTITLPGVIDLSNPVPGFDPVHASVRDMDQAALRSATSTRVEDNLYAQMVERALQANGVPLGSNLLLVGHSFGADTAADLTANQTFADRYNVTHLVAAAYDSIPQLAHIDSNVDVLILQNEDDKAILLESSQRGAAMSYASVSVDTFAHEVRQFDGGWGADIGHHQDRYITYLETTDDEELTRFYESVAAVGYGNSGTSVAVDVTLDESLRPR